MAKTTKTDDSGDRQKNKKQVNIHIREAEFVLERDGNVNGSCSNYTFRCLMLLKLYLPLFGVKTTPSAVYHVVIFLKPPC
jgi:hypothetical protein